MSHCSTPSDPPAVPTQKAGAGTALCVAHVVEGRAVIVRATGEIDVATAPMLGEHLRSAHDLVTAPFPIVADLAGVTFLGSAGLTVLAEQHQVCAQRGTVLLVVADGHAVTRAIQISGLDRLLQVHSTVSAALIAITGDEDGPRVFPPSGSC